MNARNAPGPQAGRDTRTREFHVRDVRQLHRLGPAIKLGIATAAQRDIGSQL
jgi:hypothetical protein